MSKKNKEEIYEENLDKWEEQYAYALERLNRTDELGIEVVRAVTRAHIFNKLDVDELSVTFTLPKCIINMLVAAPEERLDWPTKDHMEALRIENEESDEEKIEVLLQIMRLDADVPEKYREALSELI